jgi:hypothetical protein
MSEIKKETIIQSIANLAQSKNKTWLSHKEFLAESGITSYQLNKYFIRWNDAVIAAGLQPLDKTGRPDKSRGMTKQELLDLAEQIASRLGRRRISQSEFTKEAGISYRPIHRLFGSWTSFTSEAGLKLHPAHKQKIPDESLFKEYFRITAQLGHFPTYQELSLAKYSSGTFEGRFGTYSDFKVHALQYGIEHGLVEPDIAKQEMAKPTRQRDKGISYEPLNDRPVFGHRIDFRGLLHAPINELGVVYLFGILSQELGFVVESVQAGFPDCQAKRRLSKDRWQSVRIEFEFKSSNFIAHGHNLTQCDMIVCWEHDWTDCPIEVICLKEIVEKEKA